MSGTRNGIVLLTVQANALPVTPELVSQLRDEDRLEALLLVGLASKTIRLDAEFRAQLAAKAERILTQPLIPEQPEGRT